MNRTKIHFSKLHCKKRERANKHSNRDYQKHKRFRGMKIESGKSVNSPLSLLPFIFITVVVVLIKTVSKEYNLMTF